MFKTIQPRTMDIVLFNIVQLVAGYLGGMQMFIYSTMTMFFIYTFLAWKGEFLGSTAGKTKQSFTWGLFVILDLLAFGSIGLAAGIQSAIYFYILFYLIMPLARTAKEKYVITHKQE